MKRIKIRLLEEEVDSKESAGSAIKLELENLKQDTLEALFDKQKTDDDCNFINAITTWINEQRCDCNGYIVEKKNIKKILKENAVIKDIKMDCTNKAKEKDEKKKLADAKKELNKIAESFGSEKPISSDGGEYKKPEGDGA